MNEEAVRLSNRECVRNRKCRSTLARSQADTALQQASLLQAELSLILGDNIEHVLGERS
jgi:hypothetical protein